MWKICHDLYYLRHRSLRFDLAILGETLYAMVLDESVQRDLARRLRDAMPDAVGPPASSPTSAMSSERLPRGFATGAVGQPGGQEVLVEPLQPADENV